MAVSYREKVIRSRIILALARAFEQGGYYGFRSLIAIYMVNELGGIGKDQAWSVYQSFAMATAALPLIGGLIGDLTKRPALSSTLGVALSFIGSMTVLIPGHVPFYLSLSLIALGTGLFSPNVKALFGRSFQHDDRHMDSGWTLFYFGMTFFTLLTPALPSFLGTENNFGTSFAVMGLLPLISLILLLAFFRGKEKEELAPKKAEAHSGFTSSIIGLFFVLVIATIVAWSFYGWSTDLLRTDRTINEMVKSNFGENGPSLIFDTFTSRCSLYMLIAASVLWFFWKIPTHYKLAAGFLLYGFSALFVAPILIEPDTSKPLLRILLTFLAINTLFEAITSPPIKSMMTQLIPSNWLATAFGAFSILTTPSTVWMIPDLLAEKGWTSFIPAYIFGIIMVALAIFFWFWGRKNKLPREQPL